MGDAIKSLVLNTIGSNPQGTNDIIVAAAISCAFQGILEHDHHAVLVGLAARAQETHHVAIDVVEVLDAAQEIIQVNCHAMPIEVRSLAEVVAKPFLPETDHIGRAGHPVVAPRGLFAGEVIVAQIFWDVYLFPFRKSIP